MGNIMTRAAVTKIMADEGLTPEQRTEQIMSLYGRALDDGYIVTEDDMIECEGNFFIGRNGKVYEYDYYLDVAAEINGVAYKTSGFSVTYDEDRAVWINVMK